ncbi:hypothetical protein [Acinetobacter sp. WZC-1]|uniref:hypothetical protein n=1 Tax=Acinetobacter sp. WZC-1 TaxID=3459034 RepID=UPI00403DB9CC
MKNIRWNGKYRTLIRYICVGIFLGSTTIAAATEFDLNNLTIKKIRAVGNYSSPIYANTVELWFTTPLTYPNGMKCNEITRVYVDVKHKHIISTAYLAVASKKKVNIHIDDALPIRTGACEISFLDLENT